MYAAEAFIAAGGKCTGQSSIEAIAALYGSQAVVVSVDPKRVYVDKPEDTPHATLEHKTPDDKGRTWCW